MARKFVDSVCSTVSTVARKFVDSVCSELQWQGSLLTVCAVTIVARKFVDSVCAVTTVAREVC